MKKFLLSSIFIFACFLAKSQDGAPHPVKAQLIYAGFKGGGQMSWYKPALALTVTENNPVATLTDEKTDPLPGWHTGGYIMFRPSHFGFIRAEVLYSERGFAYISERVNQTLGYVDIPVSIGFSYRSLKVYGGLMFDRLVRSEVDDNLPIKSNASSIYTNYGDYYGNDFINNYGTNTNYFFGLGLFSNYVGMEVRYIAPTKSSTHFAMANMIQFSLNFQTGMFKPFHDPYNEDE